MTLAALARALPFIALALAFLIGSIPFGLFAARIFMKSESEVALREFGSGNIGATNVTRLAGFWPAGFLTFLLDAGKGALPVFLILFPPLQDVYGQWFGDPALIVDTFSPSMQWGVGLATVLGHCYSPWLHFRGGKGISTSFGVACVLSPWAALAGLSVFAVTFFHKRIVSLSSLAGLFAAVVTYLVLHSIGIQLYIGAVWIWVILQRHEANIDALLEGRESSL